jgi:type I restriction-modification system DNA methylase subunit
MTNPRVQLVRHRSSDHLKAVHKPLFLQKQKSKQSDEISSNGSVERVSLQKSKQIKTITNIGKKIPNSNERPNQEARHLLAQLYFINTTRLDALTSLLRASLLKFKI